jgi:sigma-B regulation protein RsbU (phosphoserine phosphatase)
VNSVERAYKELLHEGLVVSDGKGIFVAPLTPEQKQAIAGRRLLGKNSFLNVLQAFSRQLVSVFYPEKLYAIVEENRQMEEELLMARQIQAGLLPKELPDNNRLQLAAYSEPSRTIGGDFYDYLPIAKHRCGLVIADACGKGMPAAMLIAQLQAILKNETGNGQSLRQTMRNLNQHVKRYTSAKNFATLFYGVFDQCTGILEFANAGHNYPILVRQNGAVELLKTTGPALGLHPDWNYATATIKIGAGDALLLYTDGVNETMNRAEEQYGEERLQDLLVRHRECSAKDLIRMIIEDLNAFHGSMLLQDDRTMMVLKALKQTE